MVYTHGHAVPAASTGRLERVLDEAISTLLHLEASLERATTEQRAVEQARLRGRIAQQREFVSLLLIEVPSPN